MKTIFITGGAGFIGSSAAEFFAKKRWNVYILDNLSRKGTRINLNRIKDKIKKFYFQDIKNYKELNLILRKIKPDVIIHAAGQVAVTKSIVSPREDFNDNILGTLNLLEVIRTNKLKCKLIYTSTNKVYGNLSYIKLRKNKDRYFFKNLKKGINEELNLDFHSPYGCSKGSADQYINDYSRIYNIDGYVLRQSCIYGTNQFGIEDQGWVSWFIIASILKKKFKVYGDGKQVRDILYIDDLNKLYYKIALNKKKLNTDRIFNVGGGYKFSLSLLELFKILKKEYGLKLKYSFQDERKGDQKIFISDNSKVNKIFNWSPKIDPINGIKILTNWVIKNKKKVSSIV